MIHTNNHIYYSFNTHFVAKAYLMIIKFKPSCYLLRVLHLSLSHSHTFCTRRTHNCASCISTHLLVVCTTSQCWNSCPLPYLHTMYSAACDINSSPNGHLHLLCLTSSILLHSLVLRSGGVELQVVLQFESHTCHVTFVYILSRFVHVSSPVQSYLVLGFQYPDGHLDRESDLMYSTTTPYAEIKSVQPSFGAQIGS